MLNWFRGSSQGREVSRDMIDAFIKLDSNESIRRFAQKWGFLGVRPDANSLTVEVAEAYAIEGSEPLWVWRYYVARARALLNLVVALKKDKLGDIDDWGKLGWQWNCRTVEQFKQIRDAPRPYEIGSLHFPILDRAGRAIIQDLDFYRDTIAEEINAWLERSKSARLCSQSDFVMQWKGKKEGWALEINYDGNLFAAIAMQLALIVADAEMLFSCTGCGNPYIRPRSKRRPKPGWGNYCDACSKSGQSQKRAAASYRKKRATARRLHAEGLSISKIAVELETTASRVEGWLRMEGKNGKKKTRK
jgi:hypothetical protein